MRTTVGRLARVLLLTTVIATALALPRPAGTPLMPANGDAGARM
jgi:hypothetical protein